MDLAASWWCMADPKNSVVLLVDDEPPIRMVASQGLEDAGFVVVEADCAESALKILTARADVGVLFTDVDMPGALDGLDLARLVHERWPAIQLVLTSGRGLRVPVPDYGLFVAKPYSIEDLTKAVAQVAKRGD